MTTQQMSSQSKLHIAVSDPQVQELIVAWASTYEPEAIVENEDSLEIYLADGDYRSISEMLVQRTDLKPEQLKVVQVESKNWNAEWEANFKPISIDDLYIRATFHEPSPTHTQELIISPKMAFGTGHHETTYMMLQYLNQIDLKGQSVLDYGCGTGILTVFAKMRGCDKITGLDIQEEAIENTTEHFHLNSISTEDLTVKLGDLDQIRGEKYDLILANINRHILLKNANALRDHLAIEGRLMLSGILRVDKVLITNTYSDTGLELIDEKSKGEWCCFLFELSSSLS